MKTIIYKRQESMGNAEYIKDVGHVACVQQKLNMQNVESTLDLPCNVQ